MAQWIALSVVLAAVVAVWGELQQAHERRADAYWGPKIERQLDEWARTGDRTHEWMAKEYSAQWRKERAALWWEH
jgi:hypothetical protein